MILTDESGRMHFDFTAFCQSGLCSAEHFDIAENKCDGLKLVDFIAENDKWHVFIEAKNYANTSGSPKIQANMNKRQKTDYRMLTDPDAAFPLETGMVFKDSLFRWLASGKKFVKPIVLLLVINPPQGLMSRERERLTKRIEGYIPSGMNNKLDKYKNMENIFFAMLTLDDLKDAKNSYGFTVSLTL